MTTKSAKATKTPMTTPTIWADPKLEGETTDDSVGELKFPTIRKYII